MRLKSISQSTVLVVDPSELRMSKKMDINDRSIAIRSQFISLDIRALGLKLRSDVDVMSIESLSPVGKDMTDDELKIQRRLIYRQVEATFPPVRKNSNPEAIRSAELQAFRCLPLRGVPGVMWKFWDIDFIDLIRSGDTATESEARERVLIGRMESFEFVDNEENDE